MTERRRVAAIIEGPAGRVLMVRQRARGPEGWHDGPEYWTLPGGGIEPGEEPVAAVRREDAEEVGLRVTDAEKSPRRRTHRASRRCSASGLLTVNRASALTICPVRAHGWSASTG
jgi:8-oxo-dGTP pyrophosphatase MutT (NUDIX family)